MRTPHQTVRTAGVAIAVAALLLAGCAAADDPDVTATAASPTAAATGAPPVIEVEMLEFSYAPATIELTAGEPVILRFTNTGEAVHEAMVGDAHMQEEFAASGDHGTHGGDDHHDGTMAVTLDPGASADLEVVIDEPGTWYIGCHIPGHYQAGMKGTLVVG